jgi:nitrate/TMAO reductase-like tetraheme cytochrome c subunit
MESPQTPNPPTPTPSRWHRILGIRPRNGRWLRFTLTPWGFTLVAAVAMLVGGIGFAEYSMQPDFCRSCHLMEPYYQAWHDSTHRDVPCGDCHFEPGWQHTIKGKFEASSQAVKFVTGTYGSKPHAEVRDSSCLRSGCHEQRLLEGKVNWEVPTQQGRKITIRFDHTPHLGEMRRGKQLRCVSCHSQMVQGQHIVVTLDTCFLCHFKGLEHGRHEEAIGGCTSCHEAPKEEIRLATGMFQHRDYINTGVTCESCHAEVISGDGAVPRQMCWNCHNKPQQIARYGEPQFLHRTHVSEHKVECSSCHVQIEHNLTAALPTGRRIEAGHQPQDAGRCAQCHEQMHGGPMAMYSGTGARGVPDMPSPMYRTQVDCIACHRDQKQTDLDATLAGQTFLTSQESCDRCHGNQYEGTLDVWKKTVAEHLQAAKVASEEARLAYEKQGESLDAAGRLEVQRLMDDATHNIRLVELGHGVHNVIYATAALNVAADSSRKAVLMLGGQVTPRTTASGN